MTIKKQIKEIQLLIKNTAESCHRDPKDISLLAVTKSQPASVIREAYNEGLRHFAESYWQE
ncbi:MAG: YggS family pyridoxal phosphate enzyme, partial [Proteobacteria bacterium]|nr:YggS family pyridoxal phosphate enzyme [Pseudomonadota bacterium]